MWLFTTTVGAGQSSQESCPLMLTFGLILWGPRLANVCLGLVQLTMSIMVPNYEQYMNTMIKLYTKHFLIVGCLFFLNDRNFSNNILYLVSISTCDICACTWFGKSLTKLRVCFYVCMLTESGTKWASVLRVTHRWYDRWWWDIARPRSPQILQGTCKRTRPSTMTTNESIIILTI